MQLGRSTCCVFCHQYRTRLGGGGGGGNCTPGVKRREGTRAIVPAESSDLSSPPGLTMINPSPAIWPRRPQRERSRPRSIHTTNIIIFKHHTSSSDAAIRRGAGSNKSVFAWKWRVIHILCWQRGAANGNNSAVSAMMNQLIVVDNWLRFTVLFRLNLNRPAML